MNNTLDFNCSVYNGWNLVGFNSGLLSGLHADMFIGSIDKLNHVMTSYKTRHSSYGNPTGCMEGTRVEILKDLETWALNDPISKVYWLVGMAGTGKSTILHTLCEILDGKNKLGGTSSVLEDRKILATHVSSFPRLLTPWPVHRLL